MEAKKETLQFNYQLANKTMLKIKYYVVFNSSPQSYYPRTYILSFSVSAKRNLFRVLFFLLLLKNKQIVELKPKRKHF